MPSITGRDSRPIYQRVKDDLKERIITGAYIAGDQLPGVRELAQQLTINPNTIARAYRELELEGYIESIQGRGSFVSEKNPAAEEQRSWLLTEFDRIAGELLFLGYTRDALTQRLLEGSAHV